MQATVWDVGDRLLIEGADQNASKLGQRTQVALADAVG
jgi:hypothetical protein